MCWIKDAQMLEKIAETGTLESKKSVLLKIYGSNLVLKNNEIVSVSIPPYNTLRRARKIFFTDTEKPFQIKEEFSLVRVGRIELPSRPWQGRIISHYTIPA